jgi:hypothetical protein
LRVSPRNFKKSDLLFALLYRRPCAVVLHRGAASRARDRSPHAYDTISAVAGQRGRGGEIGRRDRLKICFLKGSAGSIPARGTTKRNDRCRPCLLHLWPVFSGAASRGQTGRFIHHDFQALPRMAIDQASICRPRLDARGHVVSGLTRRTSSALRLACHTSCATMRCVASCGRHPSRHRFDRPV